MLNETDFGNFVSSGDVSTISAAICGHAETPPETLTERRPFRSWWLLENRRWDVLARQYLVIFDSLCDPHE